MHLARLFRKLKALENENQSFRRRCEEAKKKFSTQILFNLQFFSRFPCEWKSELRRRLHKIFMPYLLADRNRDICCESRRCEMMVYVFYFTCVIWCIYISFLGRWILEVPSKLCLTMRVTFKFLSRPFCSHLKKRPIYITHSSRFLREPYFVGPRFSLLVKVTVFLDLWGFGPLGLSPFHWFK